MVEFVYDNEGNSAFWDDGDVFNKYMSETLGDTVEGGLDVANESWFKHDTGGTITAVDDLEDWVRRNLDLSLAPNCKIIDIYNDDMPSIFVGIQGPENEIEEIKNWQPSIWEFKLNPNYVNKIGSSTYELVFGLPDYIDVNPDGFGRNDNEPSLKENKEPAENKLDESRIPHHFDLPPAFECVVDMCNVFDKVSGIEFKDQIHLRVRGGGTSIFDNIGLSVQSAIDYCDQNDCEIDAVQICKGNDILYWVYFTGTNPIHFSSKKPDRLDDFKSYSKEEFRRDIQQIAEDIKAY